MRCLFIFLTCALSLFGAEDFILKKFPSSTKEIIDFTQAALKDFDAEFLEFKDQSLNHLDFTKAVTRWGNIIDPLFTKGIILSYLPLITSNLDVMQKADFELKEVQQKLWMAMNDPKALSIFLTFAKDKKNWHSMSPYQVYTVNHILQNIEGPLKEEALSIQSAISSYKMQSFMYFLGEGKEKTLPKNQKITLLSWNVCLLEGGISMLFGGVIPWQQRIERILSKLQKLDPDVLCLQEVFSPKAGQALIENLKSKYAHFYYNMGPNPIGFSLEALGIPGGLFVASKYPLKKGNFIPFKKEETPSSRTYGFFTADIYSDNKPLARLITTHLQPGSLEKDKEYRALQSKAILASLEKVNLPTLLCGDFNIVKNTPEAKEIFKPYESSSYLGLDFTCCELRDYWWKAKQNVAAFKALPPDKEWLDYFFYLKNSSKVMPELATKILIANDLTHPEEALSDHQILFTGVTFKK